MFWIYSAILKEHEAPATLHIDRSLLLLQKGARYLKLKIQSKTWAYREEPERKKNKNQEEDKPQCRLCRAGGDSLSHTDSSKSDNTIIMLLFKEDPLF